VDNKISAIQEQEVEGDETIGVQENVITGVDENNINSNINSNIPESTNLGNSDNATDKSKDTQNYSKVTTAQLHRTWII